ncbi:MAG TPA: hypothetical protein VLF88_02965 [Candidatus Babeliales bacterium]|nr:hypothetical protein [Candidatus Babeliales bacterium]
MAFGFIDLTAFMIALVGLALALNGHWAGWVLVAISILLAVLRVWSELRFKRNS